MDAEVKDRRRRLEKLLTADEIYRVYADSARELEEAFDRIAQSLTPEEREVLVGYRECRELMTTRARTVVCEGMRFPLEIYK